MIYRRPSMEADNREALARHLQTLAGSHEPPGAGAGEARAAAAQAVAALCHQEHPGLLFPESYLEWLFAGALRAAGMQPAASALLRARGVSHAETLLAASETVGMPVLWRICSGGALRPSAGWAGNEETCWVIELHALAADGQADLELFARPRLRRLLAGIAPVWDAQGGRGCLILRGATRKQASAAGRRGAAGEPWRAWCGAILSMLGDRRGWTERPRILWMPEPTHCGLFAVRE